MVLVLPSVGLARPWIYGWIWAQACAGFLGRPILAYEASVGSLGYRFFFFQEKDDGRYSLEEVSSLYLQTTEDCLRDSRSSHQIKGCAFLDWLPIKAWKFILPSDLAQIIIMIIVVAVVKDGKKTNVKQKEITEWRKGNGKKGRRRRKKRGN